jgi:tetratricopeptide (TPR) repeat protein
MALEEAKHIARGPTSSSLLSADSEPLKKLRRRPCSSPLNNRNFDYAIAGAVAAYDKGDYERAITLNTEALKIQPSADLVWLLLGRRGDCYLAKGDPDSALADYEQAAKLGSLGPHLQMNRAFALQRKGKRDEAMQQFDGVIAANPSEPIVYLNRATALVDDGKFDDALADYEKAMELDPRNIGAQLRCAELCLQLNKNQRAIFHATIALNLGHDLVEAYVFRARAFANLLQEPQARADLKTAAMLKPVDYAEAMNSLAWCRSTFAKSILRDGKKAVEEATKACELSHWKNSSYIDTLAAAYAETGDFKQAVQYEEKSIALAGPQGHELGPSQERLALYRDGKPYREKPKE